MHLQLLHMTFNHAVSIDAVSSALFKKKSFYSVTAQMDGRRSNRQTPVWMGMMLSFVILKSVFAARLACLTVQQ